MVEKQFNMDILRLFIKVKERVYDKIMQYLPQKIDESTQNMNAACIDIIEGLINILYGRVRIFKFL
jgi:hypothetical protein